MNLDRNYDLKISLKNSKVTSPSMEVYTTDTEIFNFIVTVTDQNNEVVRKDDLLNYQITLYAVKPNGTYVELSAELFNDEDKLFFDLPKRFNDEEGTYKCEFTVQNGDELLCTSSFSYKVRNPIHFGLLKEPEKVRAKGIVNPYSKYDNKIDNVLLEDNVLKIISSDDVVNEIDLTDVIKNILNNIKDGD